MGELLKNWKILIVDDEPDSLFLAQHLLVSYGAIVYTADDGLKGFDLAKKNRPHFVISDLSMPVLDGWGMVKKLKADVSTREIPVIALTANAMPGDREGAIAAGFHHYLTKPLTADNFMRDLMRLLVDIPEFSEQLKG